MRTALLAFVVIAALVAPTTAQAHTDEDDGLRVQLELPVIFSEPTPECPFGTADFRISSKRKIGSGRNCLQDIVPVDCPPAVPALFCQEVRVLMTLRLPGGSIEAEASILEVWACGDPSCLTLAVDQRWSGSVTRARRRFRELKGGSVSGGGTLLLDGATFEVLRIAEVLVIEENEEDD